MSHVRDGVGIGLDPDLGAADRDLSDDDVSHVVLEPLQLDRVAEGRYVEVEGSSDVFH